MTIGGAMSAIGAANGDGRRVRTHLPGPGREIVSPRDVTEPRRQ